LRPSRSQTVPALDLDLRFPARLDAWALVLAVSVAGATAAPPFGVALALSSVLICVCALLMPEVVPDTWRPLAVFLPLFAAGGVTIAFVHLAAYDPLEELASLEAGEVVIEGRISSPPSPASFGYMADVRVERVLYGGREVIRGGGVEVFAGDLSVGVGDRVRVVGELSRPVIGEDGFDYGRYLSTKRISAVLNAFSVTPMDDRTGWIGRLHRRTDVALGYGLRPEEAAVVRGMVLGDRSLIPEELDDAFGRSGITHVLAISGQHVAILAAGIFFVLRFLAVPLMIRNPATLGLVWLYIVIAGAPPSAIRAGVVATFILVAQPLGRQISPLHFMTTMLAAVLAYNPLLIYNAGFQLSVAAVFGILLLQRPMEEFIGRTLAWIHRRPPKVLCNLLAVSLAAQVATTPIVAASFGEVSIIGVITNLVAVPISGPILGLGLSGAVLGNVIPTFAYPLNASNGFLVTLLELLARGASAVPFASIKTPGTNWLMIPLYYLGCIPAAVAGRFYPEERWSYWAGLLLAWTALWLLLVSFG
jgi:competence protein ComEC